MNEQKRAKPATEPVPERPDRRRFLARALAGAALAGTVPGLAQGAVERPLREAEFYKPHPWAG